MKGPDKRADHRPVWYVVSLVAAVVCCLLFLMYAFVQKAESEKQTKRSQQFEQAQKECELDLKELTQELEILRASKK